MNISHVLLIANIAYEKICVKVFVKLGLQEPTMWSVISRKFFSSTKLLMLIAE